MGTHRDCHAFHARRTADIFMYGGSRPERALAVSLKALAPTQQDVRTDARGLGLRSLK